MKHASAAVRIRTSILLALALLMSYVPLPKAYSAGGRSSEAGESKAPTAPGAIVGAATLEAARRKARVAYGKLPIYFEANRGQFDPEVRFVSRGSGPKTFLTPTEAVFVLSKPQTKSGSQPEAGSRNASEPPAVADGLQLQPHSRSTAQGVAQNKLLKEERAKQRAASKAVVRMSLAGASAATQVTGLEQLPGNLNYFRGNNPDNWVTDVPIFNRVRYTQVYPGIDLIYYGQGRQLEYDFVVAPGADPRRIGFDFDGAERVEVDGATGELVVHAAGGAQLRQGKPVIYQEVEGSKRAVAGGFAVSGSRVGFALGEYDAARPLIIDPVVFSYSTYLAGENNDRAHDITVDADGNAYIAGWTESDSFPTKNAYQPGNNGFQQAFITKLDPSGSALVWSTYLGGGENVRSEGAYGITIDADRNVYVTGFTDSADFPTRNPLQPHLSNNNGGYDSFITKLNAAGNQLVFSTYFGGPAGDEGGPGGSGNGNDIGRGIALDSNNNVYVVGYTDSPAFPTTNAIQEEIDGRTTQPVGESNYFDAYLAKIDASGQFRIYSTYIGGGDDDVGLGVAVDADGNAYVTGWTESTEADPTASPELEPEAPLFPTTEGAFQEGPGGTGFTRDAFVTKVNSAGSAYVYSTFLGGAGEDVSWGIALGSDGSAYVTGYTDSGSPYAGPSPSPSPSPTPQGYPTTANAYQQENNGGYDAFLTRLGPDGSELIYSTYIGGDDDEGNGDGECLSCVDRYDGAAIAVDFAGNAYITGWTESTFVAPPDGEAVAEALPDLVFVNFPTKDAAQPQPGSASEAEAEEARDAYVAKFNTDESGEDSLIYSTFLGGSRQDEGQGIAVDLAANAYVVGWTATDGEGCACDGDSALSAGKGPSFILNGNDFPTTPGAFQEQPVAEDDGFVTKVGGGGSSTGDGEDDFSIVGRVTRPDGVSGVSGVTITLTRPDNTTATDTTDANGYYAFDDLAPGTYTVTPSGGSSTDLYSPPSQQVTITNENERADFTATQTFSISGRVTTDGTTGLGGVTITVTRATDNTIVGTATTAADGTYTVAGLLSDAYIVTPSRAFYTFAPPSQAVTVASNETGVDFIATSAPGTVGFTAAASPGGSESSRDEDDKSFQITVTRIGDTSGTTDVDYATFDGPAPGPSAQPSPGPPPASERSDYITALGRLHFAPNETTKTITIFIVDDAFVEGSEVLTLVLSNPTNNVALGPPNAVTLTIVDNDSNPSVPNPIDNTGFFVRQHYLDFLNREPDAAGLAFWSNEINKCSNPANRGPGETEAQCIDRMRVQVSKAFFLSIEFQETGFFVIRTYRAALDRHPEFREFLKDTQEIQRGVVVGQSGWEAQLEAKKQAYLRDFVRRPEFLTRYPESQTRDQYIDALFASAAFTPTTAERQQVSNAYDSGAPDQTESRARALGALADLTRFRQREFNPAFVKMQYIGYLRRNPDEPGFNFWLGVLNANNDQNQMVKAFIVSGEYRQRFGL